MMPVSTGRHLVCCLMLLAGAGHAETLRVGPTREFKFPSQAAQVARDFDTVEIDPGRYPGDVASWPQHGLTLRGINGRAHLDAQGNNAEGKAIWVVKGNGVTIDAIEFSNARADALNGAGIRFEGTNLTIRNSHFHDNQMGILTGPNPGSEIVIEGSEFNDNTVDYQRYGKLGHNIYIGAIKRFTLSHCYVHDAETGHNVKSRARENYLLYNRISDEDRASSYLVDLPDGGQAYLIGNELRQGPQSENRAMVAFAAEHSQTLADQTLYLVNNTLIDDRPDGQFLNNHGNTPAVLVNNLMIGGLAGLDADIRRHNIVAQHEKFADREGFDLRLAAGAAAIDQGVAPGIAPNSYSLVPTFEYRHPAGLTRRPRAGNLDVGAHEFAVGVAAAR